MLNGKEKRKQQAELTATKSLMATHAAAAAATQARCEAAEAQVRHINAANSKKLLVLIFKTVA